GATVQRAPLFCVYRVAAAAAPCGRSALRVACGNVEPVVDAALDLVGAGPASGALVLASEHRARTRRAADAGVALLEERVQRQVAPLHVVVRVLRRPARERIHLHEAAGQLLD